MISSMLMLAYPKMIEITSSDKEVIVAIGKNSKKLATVVIH